jgi:glucosamine--fructose-6-phosphate aminotransferase (isomerizing)
MSGINFAKGDVILENHRALRTRLLAAGRRFSSEPDSEVLARLIDEAVEGSGGGLGQAVCKALNQVAGAYAIAVLSDRRALPRRMLAVAVAANLAKSATVE